MAVIPNPKDVRLLAEEIERLETQLADARRKWSALFGVVSTSTPPAAASAQVNGNSLTARVHTFILTYPDSDHGIANVAEALGEGSLQVGRVLYRLQMDGKIRVVRRGRYQALEKETPIAEVS
jgi:hypothetical protein